MVNNAEIRVEGILNRVDKEISKVREMTDEQIKDYEEAIKEQSSLIKDRISLVSILAGREISDKSFERLKESGKDEFFRAVSEGATFETRQIPYYDQKAKKLMKRTVYFSPEAVMVTQATEQVVSEEELLIIKHELNRYELRRDKNQAKITALQSAQKEIKRVKRERKDTELKSELAKKQIRIKSLIEIGKKMMAENSVQKVAPEIPA